MMIASCVTIMKRFKSFVAFAYTIVSITRFCAKQKKKKKTRKPQFM